MKLDPQALLCRKRKSLKKKETSILQPTISKKRPRQTRIPKVKKQEFAHNLVEIRPSRIPGAGLGVFAKASIPESTKLGEYKGKIITEEEYDRLGDHQCEYIFEVERRKKNKVKRFYVDARFKKHSNWTRYVNGAKSKEQQEDVNIGSYQYGGRLFYRTNQDVQPGEELLVDYGSDYWTSDEEEDSDDESDRDSVEEEESSGEYQMDSPEIKMDTTNDDLESKMQEEDDSVNIYKSFSNLSLELMM